MRMHTRTALVLLLWGSALAWSEETKTIHQPDLVFAKLGDEELKLDFVRPAGEGPFALVVCIHGGAWHQGDKKDMSDWLEALPKQGFAAATPIPTPAARACAVAT